jgi:hypothetical protein
MNRSPARPSRLPPPPALAAGGLTLLLVAALAGPTASQPAGSRPGGSPPPAAPPPAAAPADKRPPAADPADKRPPAADPADKRAATEPAAADLERLRAEHSALKDALFRSRARREVLENALLSTQLIPVIHWEGARRYLLKTAELRLDGVRIWEAGSAPLGDNPVTLAARGVPPGGHVLGVRLEVRSRENPKLGYTSEQSFSVSLPEGKKTTVEITIDEDGDPPSYNPDIEIEIDTD